MAGKPKPMSQIKQLCDCTNKEYILLILLLPENLGGQYAGIDWMPRGVNMPEWGGQHHRNGAVKIIGIGAVKIIGIGGQYGAEYTFNRRQATNCTSIRRLKFSKTTSILNG